MNKIIFFLQFYLLHLVQILMQKIKNVYILTLIIQDIYGQIKYLKRLKLY